jgi:hypothetical protein
MESTSGLKLNEGKTIVIALHPEGPRPDALLPAPLEFQAHGVSGRYMGIRVGSGVSPEQSWVIADSQLRVRLALASRKTTTVDQRSLIAAAVIIPKLTYIAQHAWPSAGTILKFSKKIRNYVWHAVFTDEVDGMRAWLDADLAALDRTSGGLGVPNLRKEVLAMAAATVSSWAEKGTHALHIAGDVLHSRRTDRFPAAVVRVTPNSLPPTQRGTRILPTMWDTGRQLVTRCGGPTLHQQRPRIVAALGTLALDFELLHIDWERDVYRVDGALLLGSVYNLSASTLGPTEGFPCLEWLPKAAVADLHLYQDGGALLPASRTIYRSPDRGAIEDVMTWTLETSGVLWVHPVQPKWRGGGLRHAGLTDFIATLVTNFPTLLVQQPAVQEVRLVASPRDHPITATVAEHGQLAISTSALDPPRIVNVSSQDELTPQLKLTARSEVTILHVHPHPSLSRRVSLWTAGRRRGHPRRHYTQFVDFTATRRGHAQTRMRARKWTEASDQAAAGLATLEWTRIRRVLGLGPWGEQILYRLKTRAFSLYDVRNDRIGCPHSSCAHTTDVDLYHVFWTCPAARLLRATFAARWLRLGLPETAVESACFGLELHNVPMALWERIARNDAVQGDRNEAVATYHGLAGWVLASRCCSFLSCCLALASPAF